MNNDNLTDIPTDDTEGHMPRVRIIENADEAIDDTEAHGDAATDGDDDDDDDDDTEGHRAAMNNIGVSFDG